MHQYKKNPKKKKTINFLSFVILYISLPCAWDNTCQLKYAYDEKANLLSNSVSIQKSS